MSDLAVIVPTRGRPSNITHVIEAWDFTNAWDHADLILIVDSDDPEVDGYHQILREFVEAGHRGLQIVRMDRWMPMVHKLDLAARELAGRYWALGFAGDDHLPRTINWARRYLDVLREMKTGMVYGDDGYQGAKLSTEWAVTSDIVRVLDRMIPADVEHMYSDTSILELTRAAGMVRHLPEIRIEHMHPIVKKAPEDEQYRRVNSRDQFHRDRTAYLAWQRREMPEQLATLRSLVSGQPVPTVRRSPVVNRSRRVVRSAPTAKRRAKMADGTSPIPRSFRKVQGATPDDIGVTLADMAAQVTADHAIVEIGVFQGRTALLMAWGAQQGNSAHVWGIDAWELSANTYDAPFKTVQSRNWANYNVKATGYSDRVTLIHGFSLDQAESWNGPEIGLLFIDGDHSYEGARQDILKWSAHLAPGATIAVDDYGHPDWPGVAQAVDALVSEGVLEPIQIFHDRLAVTRLAGQISAITSEGVVVTSPSTPDSVPPPPVQPALEPGSPVEEGEVEYVPAGTRIEDLNTFQLRALAKARGIVLGARKDKRDAMLEALKAGK